MAFVYRPVRTKLVAGKKVRYRSKKYYARYRDPLSGAKVTRAGYTDKMATVQMAHRLERDAARRAEGLLTPAHDHAGRPLAEHVAAFLAHLRAKGDAPRHVQIAGAHLAALAAGCSWANLRDLSAAAAENWLAERRRTRARFGPGTSDNYLRELRHFGRWLVADGRLTGDPFARLRPLGLTSGRLRRTLGRADFTRLIDAARAGPRYQKLLTGPQRAVLYLAAAYTGLRAAELASLTPESFRLDADPPTWAIAPGADKAGTGDELPLNPDLAVVLGEYLLDVAPGTPLWPGRWAADFHGSKMLRRDLAAAGIPYRTKDGTFDFHALRVQYVSDLARAGVPLQIAQRLARHSDPRLTAKTYTRLGLGDLAAALKKLPRMKG